MASVRDSPVSLATWRASRSVASFFMLSGMFTSLYTIRMHYILPSNPSASIAASSLRRPASLTKSFSDSHIYGVLFPVLDGGPMFKRHLPNPGRSSAAALVLSIGLLLSWSVMAQEKTSSVVLDLDHVSICGSNLDALRQALTDVGLTPDFGGPHGNGITQMALVGFDDGSYIELIAPVKPGVTEGSDWGKFMAGEAGTCAWAVGTNVLLQQVDHLKKAGIAVTAPERGSRKRPDGMSVEWMTAKAGSGTPGSTLPFMIEDQTPRDWRVQTSASV